MRHPLSSLACFVVAASIAPAQAVPPSGTNGAPRAAAALLPDRASRLDAFFQRLVSEGRVPGVTALVVRNGEVVYDKAFGWRDLGTKVPLRTTDIFRIASQTKAITSVAAMMLWEEGRFALDDPISKYIPEFAKARVLTKFDPADSSYEARPARRQPTIRQLFTHTAGLDYADIGSDEFKAIYHKAGVTALGRPGDVLGEKIRLLGQLPLAHEPGERYIYSLGLDVLGRLVEIWSGMPLDQFFRTRIFEPLGLRDTWFALPADRADRLVALHEEVDGHLVARHESLGLAHPDYPLQPVTYFSGGGGLSSTTADYARFLQLLLDGGEVDGVRLLGRKTVELMRTNQIPSLDMAFGLGFALETKDNDYRSIVSEGTFSWGGAFNTTYWADPRERLVALVYTNVYGSTVPLGAEFRVLLYSALR